MMCLTEILVDCEIHILQKVARRQKTNTNKLSLKNSKNVFVKCIPKRKIQSYLDNELSALEDSFIDLLDEYLSSYPGLVLILHLGLFFSLKDECLELVLVEYLKSG